jgi:sugar phosphate permease
MTEAGLVIKVITKYLAKKIINPYGATELFLRNEVGVRFMLSKKKFQELLPWVICGLAAVFYSYEYLLRISPGIMVPELMQAFGISATALGNLIAFYGYAYTPMQLAVGLIMDKYGPRLVLSCAVFFCAVGTAIFGSSLSFEIAALGRFLIGFGSAFAFVGVLKLAAIWLPPDRFGMVSGLATSLGMMGAIFGQVALSKVIEQVGWGATISYSGYFGFLLLPMMWFIVRDKPEVVPGAKRRKIPVIVEENHSYRALAQQLARVLSSPQILINGLIGGLIYLPTSIFAELWGVQYMSVVHGIDHQISVRAVGMIPIGWAVGGPLLGWFSDKIHLRKLPLLSASFVAAGILVAVMFIKMPIWLCFTLFFLFGVISSAQVICFAIGRENCKSDLAGIAVASTNFIVMLSAAAPPLFGKILDMCWDGTMVNGMQVFKPYDFKMAMIFLPIGMVIAGCLTFFLKETHARAQV